MPVSRTNSVRSKWACCTVDRKYDMSANGATDADRRPGTSRANGRLPVRMPMRGGYTKADDTKAALVRRCAGQLWRRRRQSRRQRRRRGTGGHIWQVQYVYHASKRTEFTAGYVNLSNDSNARYSLGGLSAGTIRAGESQSAFAVSMKNTF